MNKSDWEYLTQNLNTSDLMGSDSCLGNIFLLQNRYKISTITISNLFIRKYDFSNSIFGYTFPISFSTYNDSFLNIFYNYITNNEKNSSIPLCLFTENQKNLFNSFLSKYHPSYSINWNSNPNDSDYIYLQENLSKLKGIKLQKKKNHIVNFYKKYLNTTFVFFDKSNFSEKLHSDFLSVTTQWIQEHNTEDVSIFYKEQKSIELALENIELFNFFGGILYVKSIPIAVTLASPISNETVDIHFEKCLQEASKNGGYTVINNLFSIQCSHFKYINREEDLGIEGLRKSKLSYNPTIILKKYYGQMIKN